jgi:hypothetical protein
LLKSEQTFPQAPVSFHAYTRVAEAMLHSLQFMSARRIWGVTEKDFPANGSPRRKMEFALIYVALAPTESNWKPWYFHLAEAYVELMAKNDPAHESADPDRREFMIGCGSALLYLKLSLKHFGCLGRVDLFPDLGKPALVARVHFGFGGERDAREKLTFEAMLESRANVSPLGETPVTETMLTVLGHAAAGERGWLDFVQSEVSRQQVLEVTLADDFWNGVVETDGEPASMATLAVVKTKTDDKHGWLEAGQTMARAVLQAQALGLSWTFLDPVRSRAARRELRLGVGHKGFAQVILRFGPLMADEMVPLAAPTTATAIFR